MVTLTWHIADLASSRPDTGLLGVNYCGVLNDRGLYELYGYANLAASRNSKAGMQIANLYDSGNGMITVRGDALQKANGIATRMHTVSTSSSRH